MPTSQMSDVIHQLRRMELLRDGAGRTDGQLLDEYLNCHEEAALVALVRRHAPMVWGVCRRVLRNHHDAEDAFQATFLVLVRRATSIACRELFANWLYGVAYQTALKTRAMTARRATREKQVATMPEGKPVGRDRTSDLQALLDSELCRLPDKYRTVIVLCDLEDKTRKEAARLLRCPEGTVAGRLARARAMLAKRLTRRRLAVSGGALGMLLTRNGAAASVPADAVCSAIRAATAFAAGGAVRPLISANVAAIAEGVLKAMLLSKLKLAAAFILVAATLLAVAGLVILSARPPRTNEAAASPPSNPLERQAKQGEGTGPETADQRATRLARGVHAEAAAFDKLPRFSYWVRTRHGVVDSMRAVDLSAEVLKNALTSKVLEKDWIGWYEKVFAWDEKRFITELLPAQANLNYSFRFGTADDAWDRAEAQDKSSRNFTRFAGTAKLWDAPDHPAGTLINLFDFSFLRLTPHQYRWGRTVSRTSHQMTFLPPEKITWKQAGTESFGGELCDVVESAGAGGSRLWISQANGRVRGILSYPFADAAPNELAQFDDYREIAPGVWLAFREVRAFPHASETPGKRLIRRCELVVEEARTNRDLADRYAQLLPKEGDRVQDQRFVIPVEYEYRVQRTDEEIRKQAEAAKKERTPRGEPE